MKQWIIIVILAIFPIYSRAQEQAAVQVEPPDRGFKVKVGDQTPDNFVLKFTDGTTTSLKALRGKVVLLQLTASYCSGCREKFPILEKDIWRRFKGRPFELIAIDRDEPLQTAVKFRKAVNISYPMALDPGAKIFKEFTTKDAGIARDIVIGPSGKIIFLSRLYDPAEYKNMIAAIEFALYTKPGGK